jgi:phytanoyl-CoA hydroxylase
MKGLSLEQLQTYQNQGYLVIPNFLSPKEIQTCLQEASSLLHEFDPAQHPATQFTTSDKGHVSGSYFLESGDKIRYFLEEESMNAEGRLSVPKEQAVNKIGHGLHLQNKIFQTQTLNESIKEIAHSLSYKDPRVLQSMLIFKQAKIGGAGKYIFNFERVDKSKKNNEFLLIKTLHLLTLSLYLLLDFGLLYKIVH